MFLTLLTVIVFVLLMRRTYKQTHVWQNDVSLWRHQLMYYPNEPIALNGLVAALRNYDDFREAEDDFRKIVRLKAEGYEVNLDAKTAKSVERVTYIIQLLNRAHTVAPDYVDIPYKLGVLYQDLGLYQNAVEMYDKTVKIDSSYKKVYLSLGRLYIELKDPYKAALAFSRYFSIPPIKEEHFIDVIQAYNEALKLDGEYLPYKSALFKTLESYVKFINSKKSNADSYYNLAIIYVEIGELPRAISILERALQINPEHPKATYYLGGLYMELRQWDKAKALFSKSADIQPRNADSLIKIGNIYNFQGQLKKSQEYYEKAIRRDPKNPRAYFHLAYIHENAREYGLAQKEYQAALQYDPKNPEVYFNLGNVYFKQERLDAAMQAYLKAVELEPNHLDSWVNLAIISYNRGMKSEAKKYYDEAVLLGYEPTAELLGVFESIQ